jgi:hypothetical protein
VQALDQTKIALIPSWPRIEASSPTVPRSRISCPPDLTLQQKLDQALESIDDEFPPDPCVTGFPSPTLQTSLPTVAAQIESLNDDALKTNTISLVNHLLKRRNDPQCIFYRFVKRYEYHGGCGKEEEKLHYRFPHGPSAMWVTPKTWHLAMYNAIHDNSMGIRIATVPQAIGYAFSRFLHYNILKRHYLHLHPPPTDLQFFVAPLLTFVKALYIAAGLQNSIPALVCCQVIYATPMSTHHRVINVPDDFERLDCCYVGFAEERDTWPNISGDGVGFDSRGQNMRYLAGASKLQKYAAQNYTIEISPVTHANSIRT